MRIERAELRLKLRKAIFERKISIATIADESGLDSGKIHRFLSSVDDATDETLLSLAHWFFYLESGTRVKLDKETSIYLKMYRKTAYYLFNDFGIRAGSKASLIDGTAVEQRMALMALDVKAKTMFLNQFREEIARDRLFFPDKEFYWDWRERFAHKFTA